ncbi:DUF6383 domain-containing protein [Parabacteroides leei]|uniref:DUF6383 domain-containing protein n=1 Tax=Parabacteroides leei TaxID=2939491 RepID=UPI00293EE783|nr:DUF6383 domain-containing protein [Parabacteroides leei]
MNKKFSTLMTAGLLMVGALFSSANAADPTPKSVTVDLAKSADLGKYYYIGLPAAAGEEGSEYLKALEVTNTTAGSKYENATFTSLEGKEASDAVSDDYLHNDLYLFQVVTVANGPDGSAYFKLVNKGTKQEVVFNPDVNNISATSLKAIAADDAEAVVDTYVSLFSSPAKSSDKREIVAATGFKFTPYNGDATANTNALKLASGAFTVDATGAELQFFAVPTVVMTAEDLNDEVTGFFSFKADKIATDNNIFEKNHIKAFEVEAEFDALINPGEGRVIPAGTYLATSWPKELDDVTVITSAEESLFRACTFITLSSSENLLAETHKDEQKDGKNFAITTMMGKDFNFYTGTTLKEDMTNGTQVSILNAVFKVTTSMNNEDKYAITIENFRFQKEAGKPDHGQKAVQVGTYTIHSLGTLTTVVGDPQYIFAFTDANVVDPLTLINNTGKTVYNIRFLSGITSEERGKYLTVGRTSTTTAKEFQYLAYPASLIDATAPQSQFVVSDVNEENKTITFTNRETGNFFVAKLYNTEKEGEYYVASARAYALGADVTATLGTALTFDAGNVKNGKIVFSYNDEEGTSVSSKDLSLVRKTIELVPVSVTKYDGFVNNEETSVYGTIAFAKDNSASSSKMYAATKFKASECSLTVPTSSVSEAALFEFIKCGEINDITNNYAYKRDAFKHEVKSKGDSVVYCTYAIKLMDLTIGSSYYLSNDPAANFVKINKSKDAPQFVLKKNLNGSVSIMPASVLTDPSKDFNESSNPYINAVGTAWATSLSVNEEGEKIEADGTPYTTAGSVDVKSYLLTKAIGFSLEAKQQNVALKARTGGYLSMTDSNEANLAIKTVADEDLTFLLDTADSKATLPSFFVSHNLKGSTDRLFMYYSVDSATYSNPGNIYEIEGEDTYKVMFKAATLVSPDTLNTVVNDVRVNVAKELDGEGTLGGLNNFKFNIFRNDESDDYYVVRCVENKKYLKMDNGFVTLTDNYASAMKFAVESMSSPVANEGINTSEVSVVATTGAIIIKGAEGKKVAISNILGQTIVNTVISSDNATISAPAGIIVVAVEGEAAVKAIVK